ncbi:MAG: radical SAM protein [Nitrospira sp.]|nr:radical SAM protein [Nitrospira sp.]
MQNEVAMRGVEKIEDLEQILGGRSVKSEPAGAVADELFKAVKGTGVARAVFQELITLRPDVIEAFAGKVAAESHIYANRVNVESLKEMLRAAKYVSQRGAASNRESDSRIVESLLEIQSRLQYYDREFAFGELSDAHTTAPPEAPKATNFVISISRMGADRLVIRQTSRSRRILLLNPSQNSVYGAFSVLPHPSLGLAYIGTVLKQAGHSVSILDADSAGLTRDMLMAVLRDERIEIVGIITVTPIYNNVVKLCSEIKKEFPAMITVIGGIHPTLAPMESMAPECFDFAVKGEGEQTCLDLIEAINAGGGYANISGLVYREGGKVVQTAERPLIAELDSIPYPDWSLIKKMEYSYPDALYHPVFPIFTSRGCPAACTYCQTKNIFTRRLRNRSAENIVGEIEHLVNAWGAREIHIWDDVFTANKKVVFEVRDLMRERGLKIPINFPNGIRADEVDPDVFKALKEMGTYQVAFGIESGNEEILEILEKGCTKAQVRDAVRWAKEAGLEVWGYFLIGAPGENRAKIEETIDFAIALDVDIAKFHIIEPYPGSKIFYQLASRRLIDDYNYDNYGIHTGPVHHLEDVSCEEMLGLQKTAYRRFYLRPRKLLQHVLRLKSFNRLRVNLATAGGVLRLIFGRETAMRAPGQLIGS